MKRRIVAQALCLLLCAVLAVSHVYIALETGHDCSGEHCHICLELRVCLSLIRGLSHAAAAAALIACAAHRSFTARVFVCGAPFAHTPISLKVRLLN